MSLRPVLPILLVASIVGCTKPEAAFVGKWQLDPTTIKMVDAKNGDPPLEPPREAMVLEFRANKSFSLSSKEGDNDGTFQLDGSTGTLTVSNPKSVDDRQPMRFSLKEDRTSLTVTNAGSIKSMTFKKL